MRYGRNALVRRFLQSRPLVVVVCAFGCGLLTHSAAVWLTLATAAAELAAEADQSSRTTSERLNRALDVMRLAEGAGGPCTATDLDWLNKLVFSSSVVRGIARTDASGSVTCATSDIMQRSLEEFEGESVAVGDDLRWLIDRPETPDDVPAATIASETVAVALVAPTLVLPQTDGVHRSLMLHASSDNRLIPAFGSVPFDPAMVAAQLSAGQGTIRLGDWVGGHSCAATSALCTVFAAPDTLALYAQHRFILLFTFIGAVIGAGAFYLAFAHSQQPEVVLRRAIRRNQLTVHYQPQVDFMTGAVVGCEALVRWTREGIAKSPVEFVALAEEHGFIHELTERVVSQALREMAPILTEQPTFTLSINVPAHEVTTPGFAERICRAIEGTGVDPTQMVIELTERTAGNSQDLPAALERCRAAGFKVAIDDFGIGYCNLHYLRDLSVDFIKIDKSFTETLVSNSPRASIVPQIIELANALDFEVVMEGMETATQIAYAARHGVHCGQGWVFAPAMPANQFAYWLATSGWGEAATAKRRRTHRPIARQADAEASRDSDEGIAAAPRRLPTGPAFNAPLGAA